ncbi:pyridoxal-phosphate dependent enzyme [Corynebacterium sanguinis]|uniref:pyridoxal-phosphate dependent enzyme n=1 Tax=Corynebacterium sanguinis TaxID=2594913 RepID=UPI001643F042|nr:pyridoxal-phosphate dependent enzyme [Corynebacterium sanguinis]MCT1555161.1 pyridoxal-phosphate dependent enzyme [Corynebacterium sanguinis]MCT2047014.1 pyridoxal-phosphate dependent enzyme [Corynebacterium sanguinis]MCT2155087.1 pyridoxal-phosphate dependent enzyme [Corynebacterium sanguinis]
MEKSDNLGLLSAVGSTPLIRLPNAGATVWGKLESFNPGGSAKDRTARALVRDAMERGVIGPGSVVVESSSGNLGVALAREAVIGGWRFHCVVDTRTNAATLAHMRALGATIHEVERPDPETGDWLTARRARVAEIVTELGAVNLDQYSNRAAFTAHSEGTMREIAEQLGHAPDILAVAVSTTGTVGGCLAHIREHNLPTRVVAVDAEGSVLFSGARGDRVLPGYGAGMVTELSTQVVPDEVIRVSARDAVAAARATALTTGFMPGASGGAVAWGVDKLVAKNPGAEIVAVFHDDGRAYLDTVYNDEWVERNIG